jgi:hypothetical protein
MAESGHPESSSEVGDCSRGLPRRCDMNKALIGGAVVVGALVLAKRHAMSHGGLDIERFVERMPDNAPPKWLFKNITAIRENTDRILELIDSERKEATPGTPA